MQLYNKCIHLSIQCLFEEDFVVRFLNIAVIIVSACTFVIFGAHAEEGIGLLSGNTRTIVHLKGEVTVHCSGMDAPPSNMASCDDLSLSPNNEDFFTGPKGIPATSVKLISKTQSGKTHIKESEYNSNTGKSTDKFNLWYATIFQKPLLEKGLNLVTYILIDTRGKELQRGQFEVKVEVGPTYTCPDRIYTSPIDSDCNFPQNLCYRYFNENNYCQ